MKPQFPESSTGEILIVDDTPDNLRLLSAILRNQGFEVRKALNGKRALASIQAVPPDLVLLDIRMPDMNGYEICEYLKSDPATEDIPVIFISALDDTLDKINAFAVGGVDYITKPFQEAEVLARIENQLRLRQLQQQLVQQNEELTRSNRELEQFAYVVSHDLQQPLQSITGFAKIIAMQSQETLDTASLGYIKSILDAGGRMQRLIQDLLLYARVGQGTEAHQATDCNAIWSQTIENLQGAIAQKQVELAQQPLPTVLGSGVQLLQLFQNILSNAIRFSRPEVIPRIQISAQPYGQGYLFAVQDNGVGIPRAQHERIFEIFQRGQSSGDTPGTGIGLATCKKIVEAHGGAIWVDSEPEQGTTFYFTLKAA
jgi:two-component system sensor histidine kinase/response regulator